jgi:hypothetical protein
VGVDASGAEGSFSSHAALYLDASFAAHSIAYAHGNGRLSPGEGPAVGGVSELATWALFTANFGLTGVTLRRRPKLKIVTN